MRFGEAALLAITSCGVLFAAESSAFAAGEVKIAIVKTGAGFLVADGVSVIPLENLIDRGRQAKILEAKVVATEGKVSEVKLIDGARITCLYTPPKKSAKVSESFEVSLNFPSGERTETFPFDVAPPKPPELDLLVEPSILDVEAREANKPITIN